MEVDSTTPPTADESAPLLPPRPRDDGDEAVAAAAPPRTEGGRRVTILLTVCIFFVSLGAGLTGLPVLRILEDVICRRHLLGAGTGIGGGSGGGIDERLCKGADVQAELAYVVAVLLMFEAVPGLVFGFPYGLLADRIGRRPVAALSVVGLWLSYAWMMLVLHYSDFFGDVRAIWFAQFWLVIGGGRNVLVAMTYSMIADVEPADKLSDAFFIVIVATLGAHLLATFLSAQLMQIDPWIPNLLGIAILTLGGLMIAFLPETLKSKPSPSSSSTHSPPAVSFAAAARSRLSLLLADLRQSASLLHCYPIVALLAALLTSGVHTRSIEFAPQYLSKNLGWSLADAGMLMTVHVALNMSLYLLILPTLSRLLTSPRLPFRVHPRVKDLHLARASAVALTLGSLLLAVPSAPTAVSGLVVFTLGIGFSTLCRVVATALVKSTQTARLYTLISVLHGVGELAAGPAIAWLFKVGMNMGDGLAGLPYLAVAVLCAAAGVLVFTVRGSALVKAGSVEEEEGGEER